ncbi:MAG: dihydropyrimidinase [Clostridiaceae bacterium]
MSILIKNGIIVNANKTFTGDIYIENEIIKEINTNLNIESDEIIDATGKYIIPGGIDVHTHFNLDVGIAVAKDDFYTGTIAAACGGTTSIVDHMGFGPKGCNLHHQLKKYHEYADNIAVIDYGFHGVIQKVDDDILKEIEELIEEGITSFKIYLTYDYKVSDKDALRVFEKLNTLGGITCVHCENNDCVNYLREKFKSHNLKTPIYHAYSRPPECEGEAINRMINIAKIAGNYKLYIVHLSTELGLNYIKMAKESGQNVYAETCPQYLLLNEDKYKLEENQGLKYIMSPPLRKKSDNNALWQGLAQGYINTIATDHCPFDFNGEKQLGKDDFTKCPNGLPGVETRVPLIFSEGVMKNKISINKFVDVISTTPAKIFGLYPKKGAIAIGSDADLVILDPEKEIILSKKYLHENVDYTAYEGMKLKGYPVLTILRGKIIVKNNIFLGQKGDGKFIKREIS